jgi:hypothetical protein
MEPLDDRELNHLLRQWKAPAAPASLEQRVMPRTAPWWRWLIAWLTTGTIRVPVPVGLAILAALALLLYFRTPAPLQPPRPARSVSLADFRPVSQLEPRVIGRAK